MSDNNDAYVKHLEGQVEKLNQKIQDMQEAYAAGDRESQLRGWAVDRAIEYIKTGADGDLFKIADSLLSYTHTPIKKAEESVSEMVMKGAA